VLAGPFASREAAERAQKQLRNLGLTSGKVIAKAG
jgi:cell division septation protein DedD